MQRYQGDEDQDCARENDAAVEEAGVWSVSCMIDKSDDAYALPRNRMPVPTNAFKSCCPLATIERSYNFARTINTA